MTEHEPKAFGRRIFLSFLGAGNYFEATYLFESRTAERTRFAQIAELELLGPFDEVIFLGTATSFARHLSALQEEAEERLRVTVRPIELSEALDGPAQWTTFEQVLGLIAPRDRVVFDFTHGYRSVPIVLSAALEFLRRARNIEIERVLYGAYEQDRERSPIIDMSDFYAIGAWTDAVGRLVDDADARPLAALAERDGAGRFAALSTPALREALHALTEAVRNVEAHRVEALARRALEAVEAARSTDVPSGVLLDLVAGKFASLVVDAPLVGRFDRDFFRCQHALARLLVDHRLFMQAFTVMREHVASLGVRFHTQAGFDAPKRRDKRAQYGEVFIQMVSRDRDKWQFSENRAGLLEKLLPWYDALERAGIVAELRGFVNQLGEMRNGFDHAWMNRSEGPGPDIGERAKSWLDELDRVTTRAFALPPPEVV